MLDESGRELAEIRAHIFTPALKIFADGGVAEVDRGFVRGRYGINSSGGEILAEGSSRDDEYMLSLSRDDSRIARADLRGGLPERIDIDIEDGEDEALIIAIILAINHIHHGEHGGVVAAVP